MITTSTSIKNYIICTFQVKMIKLVALLNIGSLGVVIAVTLLAIHGSLRLLVLGFMCAGLTLGMYASPLGAMVRTKKPTFSFCFI